MCFEVMCAGACRAPGMQSIVLLIVLMCFQVELRLIYGAGCWNSNLPLKMEWYVEFCREISNLAAEQRRRGSLSSALPSLVDVSDIFVQVESATVRRQQERAPWRLSEMELQWTWNMKGRYWAVLVRTENKDPAIYPRRLFVLYVVS